MSSYSDIKKKVKKNTDTSSVKKSGYSASGSYAEIKSKVKANGTSYDIDDDFISTFNNDATSFLKDAGKSYSDYSYSASKSGNNYKSYLDRWSSINSRAKYIRAYMNSTRDSADEDSYNRTISFLDDFDNYSRQYLNGFRSYDNYYSNFKTEDDYDKYRFGWLSGTSDDYMKDDMVTGRQGIYNKNKQRLDEINALLPNTSNRVSSGALTMRDGYTIPTSTLSKEERDALEKEKSALEAENRKYEQFQKVKDDTYADTKNADYEKYSKQRNYGNPTKEELDREDIAGEELSVSLDGKGILYDDGEYYTLNDGTKVRKPQELDIPDKLGAYLSASKDDVTEAYNRLAGSNGNYIRTWDNLIQEGETSYWNELTEGEVDYYYYVYGTQGQEAAYNYLDNMAVILGQRHEDSVKEEVSNANAYEKVLYNIASIAASPIAGAASFVDDAKNIITGNEINPYSAAHRLQNFSGIVRSDTEEIINEATNNAAIPGLGFTAGDAYQAVMSGLDSLVGGATVGKAYSFIMGAGSASSEARKLYESGASSKQIALGSLASGVAETLFEYVSLDHFLSMKSPKTKAEWVKQVLAQGGVEASEEIATEVSNLITNAIIMGNQSDWANMTIGDAIIDVLNAGLGGFISGAGMAGVGSGARYANYNRQMTQYGKDLSKSGAMDAYVDYAESNSIGKDGKKLLGQVNKIKSNNAVDSFSSSDNSETGRFTRYEYNKMGKLADQIDSKTMENATKAEIKARLEAQGANASNKMVNSVYKQITSNADITLAKGEVKNLAEKITSDNTFDYAVSMRSLASHISMYYNKAMKESETNAMEDSVKDKVSDTNETIIESTGEAVEIKKVASIENGKMILELSDGRTVSSNDVLYSSKYQALAYETVLDLGCSADTANAIIDSVKANDATSASKYLLGVKEAYRYGLYGLDPKTVNTKVFSNELTENQMNFAYELGRNDASTKASLAQESVNAKKGTGKKEGKILYSSSVESLTARQKVSLDAAGKVVTDITHNNVVYYESVVKDGKRVFSKDIAGHKAGESAPNGFYVKGNGTIYIDINAGNNGEGVILYTLAHELTHFIKEWSPEKFKVLADFLVEEYGKQGTDVNKLIQNQIAKAKGNGRVLSNDDAFEEVVSDSMEPMFTDTNLSEKLAKLKEKDQTLWEKIKEFFSDLLAKIKEAYDGLSPQSDEGKLVKQMVDSIEKISDLFAEALVDAGETFSAIEDSAPGEVDIDGDASTHAISLYAQTSENQGEMLSDRVTDKETLDFLNRQLEKGEVTEVYRAMAVGEDGKLYPPMAGYVRENGKKVINGSPSEYNVWEQSRESIPWDSVDENFLLNNGFKRYENPTNGYPNGRYEKDNVIFYQNKNGEWKAKFHLDKDNGKVVDAEYAPYIHTSLSMLNDQFTSAYTRDNLVVVRGYVPNSEVYGINGKRYQASFAGKPVGKTKWHSGVVAAQMPETRTVILSRYFMPIEKVDDSVMAQSVKDMMKGKDIEIPFNVVTAGQRRAMEAIGIRIGEARGLKDAPLKANVKYSDRDSNGNKLSNEQQEFFKDSKVRDEDGNLRVVYHGTEEEYDGVNNGDEEYIAFNSNQIKRVDNTAPTSNPDVRYSEGVKQKRSTVNTIGNENSNSNSKLDSMRDTSASNNSISQKKENTTQAEKFSDRNPDATDNRTLLSNALATTAQNDIEKKYIEDYQSKISSINEEQRKLAELRSQIKELSFAKGKRDNDKIRELKDEATKTANRITVYDKQLLRLESTKPLKEVLTREKEIAVKKAKQAGKEALDAYKEKSLQKQKEITERYKERTERANDRRKATEVRNKIKKIASDLNKRLLNPTESRYVPQALVEGVIRVCNEIDPTGANQDTIVAQKYRSGLDALRDLKAQYDKLQSMDYEFSSEFNKDFSDSIEELANAVGGKPLRDMSRAQLEDVYTIVSDINAMVKNATKQIGIDERITNYEAGQEVISLMKKVKASGLTTGQLMSKMREWMDNPMRAVREMSAYDPDSRLTKLFDALNEGRRKADKFIMDNSKKFEVLRDTKEGEQAYIDAVEKPVDFGFGFKISKMQAMQAILTYEREQANENRKHLSAPVIFTDVVLDVKGKYSDAFDNGHEIMVDEHFVKAVMDKLSDWDKQYLEVARRLFEVDSKNAVNEVSMITKHRLVATERSYIPYKVNQDYIQKESDNVKFDATLEGSGVLKSVKSNASQQLVMRGLNTVIDEHMNTVSKIYGLSIPIRNWNKVFNIIQTKEDGGLSVKKAIRDAWGTNGVKLLDQAVADLQSPRRGDRVKLLDDIKSAFVTSTLAGNISVWMKQAASYPTAGAILSLGSLGKGLAYLPIIRKMTGIQLQELYDEIDDHTSQHWIRRQGLSTQELGDINQSKGWENKLNKRFGKASPMNWIQSMDVWTTASLWVACKAEVDKRGIGSGSEQYWEEVARLYDQVIEETQPMYDPLHRAEVTKNKMLGMFVIFQTQPLQNSGILREATMQYKMDKKTYGSGSEQVKEAGLKFRKAVASQLASHLVFTAMTLVAATILHKMNPWRDDDDELTKESVLTEFSKEFGKNVFGAVFPVFGSYAVTFAEKFMSGNRYDVLSNPTIDKINDSMTMLANAKTDILKYVEYLKDPRGDKVDPPFETLIDVFCDVASYFGIPAKNGLNIINGIRLHAEDYANGEFLSFEAGVNRTASQDYGRLYEAIISGNTAEVNKLKEKYADKYTTEVRKALKANDPRITKAAEARYAGDLPEYERIAREIKAEKNFSQDDIVAAINSVVNDLSKYDLKDEEDKEQKHKGLYTSSDIEYALENGKDSYMPAITEDFIQTYLDNGKDQEEAEESTTQTIRSVIRESYRDGDMTYAEASKALVSYTDMSEEEATSRVNYWEFQMENPDIDLKESTVNKYQELIEPEGISVNVFYEFYDQASKAEGEDLDGDGKNDQYTKMDKIIAIIDSMSISSYEKDVLLQFYYDSPKSAAYKRKSW